MFGCRNLGVMYDNGRGVAKDEKRAVGLFQMACDGGEMRGCTYLGNIYYDREGVAKDEKRAVDLYQKACNGGDEAGCRRQREMGDEDAE